MNMNTESESMSSTINSPIPIVNTDQQQEQQGFDMRPMVCLMYTDLNDNTAYMLFSSRDSQKSLQQIESDMNYMIGYQSTNPEDKTINYGKYINAFGINTENIVIPYIERSPGLWIYTSGDQPVINVPAQYTESELITFENNSTNYSAKYAYHCDI